MGFDTFLIMPPAYYKYGDQEVINFYSNLVQNVPEAKIILYNFEKLCGYKFSLECVIELVKIFPNQIKTFDLILSFIIAPAITMLLIRFG